MSKVTAPAPVMASIVVRLRPIVSAIQPKIAAPIGRPISVAANIAPLTMATVLVPISSETK